MRSFLKTIHTLCLAGLGMVLIAATAPVRAEDQGVVNAADAAAIRQVVADQLAAFQKDDGSAAFGFASPNIQHLFGTPEIFMEMVRSGYQPVYRPKHVEFGPIDETEGKPTQHVFLIGPDGDNVEAVYFMEREPDGKWKIDGCVLRPAYQA